MREGLDYEDKNGEKWFILGIGEDAESAPAKFQIRRDGFLWKDKWIETDSLADEMFKLGADINEEDRDDAQWAYFDKCINELGVQDDVPE